MNRSLVIIGICLNMLGCHGGDQLQIHLTDYQARMAKVLDVAPVNIPKVKLPPYPSRQIMSHEVVEQKIKLFEFYQLKHCALYSLVAERNTTLGRLHLPSRRYLYERALLTALSTCIEQTTDPDLKRSLQLWYSVKQQNIGTSWANLMQLSSEIKRTLSANKGAIEGNKNDGLVPTKQALDYLLKVNGIAFPEDAELEKHLKTLNNNPLPAKIWISQLILTEQLQYLTPWLTENTANLSCSKGGNKDKVTYLNNVFQLFFIEKIQPIAGQLNHYHYQLAPIFEQLIQHPDLSLAYKEYVQKQFQQGFDNYQQAMHQHIAFWQQLFKRCHLSPQKR